jgi:hypothetical protein
LRVGGKVIGGENDGDIYVADITDSSEVSDEEDHMEMKICMHHFQIKRYGNKL